MTISSVGRIGSHRLPYGTQPSRKKIGFDAIEADQNSTKEKAEGPSYSEGSNLKSQGLKGIGASDASDEALMQANLMVQTLAKKLLILADLYPEDIKASLKVLIRAIGTVSKTVPEAKLRYYKLKELEQLMYSLPKEKNESLISPQSLLIEQGADQFNPINGRKRAKEAQTHYKNTGAREFQTGGFQKEEANRTAMAESLVESQYSYGAIDMKPLTPFRMRRSGFLSGSLNIKA